MKSMLKKICMLILLCTIPVTFSRALNSTASDSIKFKKADFKTLQALAKAENKPLCIFVTGREIDANGKKSFFFLSNDVTDLFNRSFINAKLPLFTEHVRPLFEQMKIRGIPWHLLRTNYLKTLLFFDPDGNFSHFGYLPEAQSDSSDTRIISAIAHEVINGKNLAKSYPDQFDKGERSPDFLIQYSIFTSMYDSVRLDNLQKNCAQFFPTDESKINSFTIYAIEYFHLPYRHPLMSGFFRQLQAFEKKFGTDEVNHAGEVLNLVDHDTICYTSNELSDIRRYRVSLGETRGEAAAATYRKTFKAYVREGNSKDWVDFVNVLLKEQDSPFRSFGFYAPAIQLLNQTMWDKDHFGAFKVWSRAVMKYHKKYDYLTLNGEHARINYEMAEIYWRHGKKVKAGHLAREAYMISKKPDIGLTKEEKEKMETQFSKYDPHRRNFYIY
jgi:hypothetical protein